MDIIWDVLLLRLNKLPDWLVIEPWRVAFITLCWFFTGCTLCSGVMCLIHRIKHEDSYRSWIRKRSYCDNCRTTLKFWQVIPIIGVLLTKGRCPKCRHKVDWRYTVFEALSGVAMVLFIWFVC